MMIYVLVFIYGYLVGKYKWFPYSWIELSIDSVKKTFKQEEEPLMMWGYYDLADKEEIDYQSLDKNRTMVLMVYGQGNAANGGEVKYSPKHNVLNAYKGKCYRANDPLLGATDNKGTVWSRLGDKIIESGAYDNVIVKTIAVGGTPIASWTVNGMGIGYKGRLFGNYHSKILEAHDEMNNMGIPITHILWHQGESDTVNETTKDEYKESFLDMLNNMRKLGIYAPVYVAQASRYGKKTSNNVLNAQKELSLEYGDIFAGPNTDIIDSYDDRTEDGQRFSEQGLEKHAKGWLKSLESMGFNK